MYMADVVAAVRTAGGGVSMQTIEAWVNQGLMCGPPHKIEKRDIANADDWPEMAAFEAIAAEHLQTRCGWKPSMVSAMRGACAEIIENGKDPFPFLDAHEKPLPFVCNLFLAWMVAVIKAKLNTPLYHSATINVYVNADGVERYAIGEPTTTEEAIYPREIDALRRIAA